MVSHRKSRSFSYLCRNCRTSMTIMGNPFKFGTVVEGEYFTDRQEEQRQVKEILASGNHLILISPRRYGKTSLIQKVVKECGRPAFLLNLQLVTDVEDFASHLLKQVFKLYPMQRIKHLLKHFRVVPTLTVNPMTEGMELAFQPFTDAYIVLEDVLALIEKIGEKHEPPVVVLDEFQEINSLDKNLDKKLRAILQVQSHVNYIFLGSQESMMQEIFERKKSPFYHFGYLMHLKKIPQTDFTAFLENGFAQLGGEIEQRRATSSKILDFTHCHPYYTQQLAFQTWNLWQQTGFSEKLVEHAIDSLVDMHDMDYERLWATFNRTDKKVLIGLTKNLGTPTGTLFLQNQGIGSSSTVYSSLKRLNRAGYLLKNGSYEMDDPFFARWIIKRRAEA